MHKGYLSKIIGGLKAHKIIVLCDCGSTDHHLIFIKDKEECDGKVTYEYYAGVIPVITPFWVRVKEAWDLIWHGPWGREIVLGQKQIADLIKDLEELIKDVD